MKWPFCGGNQGSGDWPEGKKSERKVKGPVELNWPDRSMYRPSFPLLLSHIPPIERRSGEQNGLFNINNFLLAILIRDRFGCHSLILFVHSFFLLQRLRKILFFQTGTKINSFCSIPCPLGHLWIATVDAIVRTGPNSLCFLNNFPGSLIWSSLYWIGTLSSHFPRLLGVPPSEEALKYKKEEFHNKF